MMVAAATLATADYVRMILAYFVDDVDEWPALLRVSRLWYRTGRQLFDLAKLLPWQRFYNREATALHRFPAPIDTVKQAARGTPCFGDPVIAWSGPAAIRAMMRFPDGEYRTRFGVTFWEHLLTECRTSSWSIIIELLRHCPERYNGRWLFHSVIKSIVSSSDYSKYRIKVTSTYYSADTIREVFYSAMVCSTLRRFHRISAERILMHADRLGDGTFVRLVVLLLTHEPMERWTEPISRPTAAEILAFAMQPFDDNVATIKSLIAARDWAQLALLADRFHVRRRADKVR